MLCYADVDAMFTIQVIRRHADITHLGRRWYHVMRNTGSTSTHLKVHDILRDQQVIDRWVFFKRVLGGLSTLFLRLHSSSDEPSYHIEFSPVNL